VDAFALDGRDDALRVVGRQVQEMRVLSDAGVAGGAPQLDAITLQRLHQRVLAAAAADDEDAHVRVS
jgi:hypothetical protein